MKIDRILIVCDERRYCVDAIQYGFSLANDAGAKVMLLDVIDPESVAGNPDAGIFPDDALTARKARAESFLEEMKRSYAQVVETEFRLIEGDLRSTVITTIVEWKADMVVAATHRRNILSEMFHTSFTQFIIQQSPVPVLIVPVA